MLDAATVHFCFIIMLMNIDHGYILQSSVCVQTLSEIFL